MTSNQPRINQSGFVTVEQDKVLAIVPDGHLDDTIAALADAGVDPKGVDVLQGEEAARIRVLSEHGCLRIIHFGKYAKDQLSY
ncbi:MAG TPA: hypothetical protein VGE11_12910 [Pseudonocardia sp.]